MTANPYAILQAGARRLALQRALVAALATLGFSLLAAAALILVARLRDGGDQFIPLALSLPPLAAVAGLLLGYFSRRPTLEQAALKLDRNAGTDEHLVTWLQWHDAELDQCSDIQRGFLELQRKATLARVANLNVSRALPLRWPAWTRTVWLALVLLGCALLLPEQSAAAKVLPKSTVEKMKRRAENAPEFSIGGGGSAQQQNAPFVQVLSPTETKRFQLMATDTERTPEQQQQLLKQLLGKIGNAPEKDLPPEVREILSLLREQTGQKAKSGSEQRNGSAPANNAKPETAPEVNPAGAANAANLDAKARTAIIEKFPDVQDKLERYYRE